MVSKITTFLAVFFGVLVVVLLIMYKSQGKELTHVRADNTALQANNNLLVKKLEKEHNDKLEFSKRAEEIEKAIQADSSGFNWNYNLADNPVLVTFKRLHKNKN